MIHLQDVEDIHNLNQSEGKVVLMRLDAIGDFVMSYGVFQEYRTLYRDKKIILICSASCKELAQAWRVADEVIEIDMGEYSRKKQYRRSKNNVLSSITAEIVIQMITNRTVEMEYITGLICSKNKIALSRDNAKSKLRRRWDKVYSQICVYDEGNDFEIKKYFYLLNFIAKTKIEPYQSILPKTCCSYIEETPYFVIAQGGSFPAKKWENEKYAAVGNYILGNRHIKCYLLGTNEDKEDNDLIYKMILHRERVENLTGETTILDSIEIIRDAEFVITNDTCFVHIATAVNTKSICIAGGWHWGRFVPYDLQNTLEIYNFPMTAYHRMECYNCNFRLMECKQLRESHAKERLPCIRNVSVEDVIRLIDEVKNENERIKES